MHPSSNSYLIEQNHVIDEVSSDEDAQVAEALGRNHWPFGGKNIVSYSISIHQAT